jgi:hypothetical protein
MWATVYGWYFVLAGLVCWVMGVLAYVGRPVVHPQLHNTSALLFQALLFGVTGLTIIRNKRIAVMLVWVTMATSGIGVLFRGLTPLDMVLWAASLGLAIWYTKKGPSLAEKTTAQLAWLDATSISLIVITIVLLLWSLATALNSDSKMAEDCWAGPENNGSGLPKCSDLQSAVSPKIPESRVWRLPPKEPESIFDQPLPRKEPESAFDQLDQPLAGGHLGSDELSKLTGRAELRSTGYFKGDVYNGNPFGLDSVVVQIDVKDRHKITVLTRTYDIQKTFRALSNTEIVEKTDIAPLELEQSSVWSIKSAKRAK